MGYIPLRDDEVAGWPEKASKLNFEQILIIRRALVSYSFDCHNNVVDETLSGLVVELEEDAKARWSQAEKDTDALICHLFPSWDLNELSKIKEDE